MVLIKYSGKCVKIYFNMRITYLKTKWFLCHSLSMHSELCCFLICSKFLTVCKANLFGKMFPFNIYL